jgi:hypothetical protein
MKPGIDSSLRQKYLDTDYIISDDPPLLMKVGEQSDDLRVLLGSMGVESAAFITAWNPHSEKLTDDENDDRQAVLLTDIEKMRLNYLVGYGQGKDWQEYSYLVLGIDKDQATAMATRFEQNAYVWIGPTGIPELITTV